MDIPYHVSTFGHTSTFNIMITSPEISPRFNLIMNAQRSTTEYTEHSNIDTVLNIQCLEHCANSLADPSSLLLTFYRAPYCSTHCHELEKSCSAPASWNILGNLSVFDARGFACPVRNYYGCSIVFYQATSISYLCFTGTGAISNLFFVFPFCTGAPPLIVLSLIFFFLNLSLFCSFFIILCLKYICYPAKFWLSLLEKPMDGLYAGCFPMGATTLINIAVSVVNGKLNYGGKSFLYFIWAIWWLDVFVSFACCWIGIHAMITQQEHSLDTMTTMWLLPVVTLIVASSSGGVLSRAIQVYSQLNALHTLVVSVFMVTVGLSLALMILTVYLLRLIVHGLPRGPSILSTFLPLGPTGQSGYAVLLIGQSLKTLLPFPSKDHHFLNSTSTGTIVEVVCTCVSFLLWSLATMWILYALLGVYSGLRQSRIAFRVSFWGLVFPNGVYANLTIQLGNAFDSKAFQIFGSIYAICTLIIWLSLAIRSLLELKNLYILANAP